MKKNNKRKGMKIKKNSLLSKLLLVVILLLVVLNVFRYAAYFKKDTNEGIQICIQNDVNIELEHDIYIDENGVIYLSEEDMKKYFDDGLYYEKNENDKRRYISVCQNKILEITENENHIFVNGNREKIKGAVANREGNFYFPISELESVYNIEIDYLEKKNRINIEKMAEEKIVAIVNKETNLKYKMTNISKNVELLEQGDIVTIVEEMDGSWVKVKTSDYVVGYVKKSKLINEKKERYNLGEENYNKIDIENAALIEINDNTYENFEEIISTYDNRKQKINEILDQATKKIPELEGKELGVKIDINISGDVQNYYKFLRELEAYINDIGVSLIVVNKPNLDMDRLNKVADMVI